ncbi:MAG: YlxR family protein [Chloroflexota bacterium]|nr:YlxR family protein [Chloroflexota bacterium]
MSKKGRHIPQRTCIACHQQRNKRDLIRLVCAGDESVEVDASGKKPGRGAYLCAQKACWETALKRNNLEHALRTRLSDDNREALLEHSHYLSGRS